MSVESTSQISDCAKTASFDEASTAWYDYWIGGHSGTIESSVDGLDRLLVSFKRCQSEGGQSGIAKLSHVLTCCRWPCSSGRGGTSRPSPCIHTNDAHR